MMPYEIARSYLGTRWVHQGRARRGLDCIGLLVRAFADYGVRDVTNYSRDPAGGLLERHVAEQFGPAVATGTRNQLVSREALQPNDVVLLAYPRVVRHVGIVGLHPNGGLSLIHTDRLVTCVTEHALSDEVLRQVRFVHRHPRDQLGGVIGAYFGGPYGEPMPSEVSAAIGGYSEGGAA